MAATPKHPVLNSRAQMRRAATTLLPAASGVPLIRSTRLLNIRKIWMEGRFDVDAELVWACVDPKKAQKYLPKLWVQNFRRLVEDWKEKEGYVLAPYNQRDKPPLVSSSGLRRRQWHRWGRFWVAGPFEKPLLGLQYVRDVDGNEVGIARRQTIGEERLNETGGKLTYRIGDYMTIREHLAELKVRESRGYRS